MEEDFWWLGSLVPLKGRVNTDKCNIIVCSGGPTSYVNTLWWFVLGHPPIADNCLCPLHLVSYYYAKLVLHGWYQYTSYHFSCLCQVIFLLLCLNVDDCDRYSSSYIWMYEKESTTRSLVWCMDFACLPIWVYSRFSSSISPPYAGMLC